MLDADDAGVVSQSLEKVNKVMGVIVVMCAAFGLTVSEAKTEMVCSRSKEMLETNNAIFSVEADSRLGTQPKQRVRTPREGRQSQR